MKTLLAGIFMTVILIFVNIVAAGVIMLLASHLNRAGVETDPVLWLIIATVATWCAVAFMQGAIQQARYFAERKRT